MCAKNFILDTNVLLYAPKAINNFGKNNVLIPIEVIEELDTFKRDISELGQNSRTVSYILDQLSKKGKLGVGIPLENGGKLRVYTGDYKDYISKMRLQLRRKVDHGILNLALFIKEKHPENSTFIISKNINLRLKADALGISAKDYEEYGLPLNGSFSGFSKVSLDKADIQLFKDQQVLTLKESQFHPNEYILLSDEPDHTLSAMGKISGKKANKLVPILNTNDGILGIKPLNLGQRFAFDALLNDEIKLVTLQGKAGTGKTLLAVAAGLYKVFKNDKYSKVLISRPVMPLGRDIGFIPGDIEEKMRPWMQPIYDALELLRSIDGRSRKRSLPPDLLESDDIGIEPLTYIRGRSIPNQFLIIDEAQNLTPHEIKTIVTRIGSNSKVVLTGDIEQIDNPYVDAFSNGFSTLINRFRSEEISAHIHLTKGERSELAEIATTLL